MNLIEYIRKDPHGSETARILRTGLDAFGLQLHFHTAGATIVNPRNKGKRWEQGKLWTGAEARTKPDDQAMEEIAEMVADHCEALMEVHS